MDPWKTEGNILLDSELTSTTSIDDFSKINVQNLNESDSTLDIQKSNTVLDTTDKCSEVPKENTKPTFKLGELTSSPFIVHGKSVPEIYNESDPSSFIVLAKDSIDVIQASSLASYVDIQQKSMCINYDSMISSLNANEMHLKLTEVLQENTKLKETLKQNNSMLKKQFGILEMWQQQVLDAHKINRQKFEETKILLSHLKQENAELKIALSRATQMSGNTESNFEVIDVYESNTSAKDVLTDKVPVQTKSFTLISDKSTKEVCEIKNDSNDLLTDKAPVQTKSFTLIPKGAKEICKFEDDANDVLTDKAVKEVCEIENNTKDVLTNKVPVQTKSFTLISDKGAKEVTEFKDDASNVLTDKAVKEVCEIEDTKNILTSKVPVQTKSFTLISDKGAKKVFEFKDDANDVFTDKAVKEICEIENDTKDVPINKATVQEKSFTLIPDKDTKEAYKFKDQIKSLKGEISLAELKSNFNSNQAVTKTVETQKYSEISIEKNQKITGLTEKISQLEEKLQDVFPSIQLPSASEKAKQSSQYYQIFVNNMQQKCIDNIQQCNKSMEDLTECFESQIERFDTVDRCLSRFRKILTHMLDKVHNILTKKTNEFSSDDESSSDEDLLPDLWRRINGLDACNNELLKVQTKIISDRQILVKSRDNFQKIFSDYKSILYELKLISDENIKLRTLYDNMIRDNLRRNMEVWKTTSEQQFFEEEKLSFYQEREELQEEVIIFNEKKRKFQEENKLFESQKKNLETEYELLQKEMKLLQQQKINLQDEKTSLDQQSKLYECHEKVLQDKERLWQAQHEKLLAEINELKLEIRSKNKELGNWVQSSALNANEMALLETQLTVYEQDYKEEKRLKESLLKEKNKLEIELQKQVYFNNQLRQQMYPNTNDTSSSYQPMPQQTSRHTNEGSQLVCPNCNLAFTNLQKVTEHIERCLNLD